MKIAIVSDSHASLDRLEQFLCAIEKGGIRDVIHCGDCFMDGLPDLLKQYKNIQIDISRGNWDQDEAINNELNQLPNVTCKEIIQKKIQGITVCVSHIPGIAEKKLKNEFIDIFLHGHTHRIEIKKKKGIFFLNPGALTEDGFYFILEFPSLLLQKRHYTDIL